jgi:hypothetical protein
VVAVVEASTRKITQFKMCALGRRIIAAYYNGIYDTHVHYPDVPTAEISALDSAFAELSEAGHHIFK